MKITNVEIIRSRQPIPLPQPWLAAWRAPNGEPATGLDFAFYKVNPEEETFFFQVRRLLNPTADFVVLKAIRKPYINILWWTLFIGGRTGSCKNTFDTNHGVSFGP